MKTKEQFVNEDILWYIFINFLFSAPYFGLAYTAFSLRQALVIWIITFYIEYNRMTDLDYVDYCIWYKEKEIKKTLTK